MRTKLFVCAALGVAVAAAAVACSSDTFVDGDAAADAAADVPHADAGGGDASSEVGTSLDGGTSADACPAVDNPACPSGCLSGVCCVTAQDASCASSCSGNDMLGCTGACVSGSAVCCAVKYDVTGNCPLTVSNVTTSCVFQGTCVDAGGRRVCVSDGDCEGAKCVPFELGTSNFTIGFCE